MGIDEQGVRPITSITEDAAPFQLRAASLTLLTLKVVNPADPEFFPRLATMLSLAPGFYRNAPIVLDLSATGLRPPCDLVEFCARIKEMGIIPVGIQRANAAWERAAALAGLPPFPTGRATDAQPVAKEPSKAASGTRILSEPVRSGQQVYAHKGDLIVLGAVSHGAELLADGHIHVYGPLRGRALAGMSGDKSARIFCRALDAELVSVAGLYMVSEQLDPALHGKPAQICVDGEALVQQAL
ncbi:septum site-determining protein MinC [Magnetospirillum fulvum]|uniref:Probable septum site-determining protein MinC n=1 Tax=Magnetospirillum fulvum MGU-K5 TaxID=1316936 RepID=S9SG84_MAGFU|nr:septum site-determining protein MinC [Magnetospirillum fulvum]EPY03078.1 septum site-determining protein MinC [Magnetospirillum fulvum MGU-K5]